MNAIKDAIKSGRTVVGTTAGPNVDVSILADAGYDFVLFDTQHSPWEIKQLQPSIQTMRGKQAAPLVRVDAQGEKHPPCCRSRATFNLRCIWLASFPEALDEMPGVPPREH